MMRIVATVVAVAMLLALAPLPYDYYLLLRVITFAAGAYCGYLWLNQNRALAIGLFICAAIFNPFIPAHLTREIWSVLNLGGAALFGYVAYSSKKLAA